VVLHEREAKQRVAVDSVVLRIAHPAPKLPNRIIVAASVNDIGFFGAGRDGS
jgi:hypothetical protein